MGGGGGGGGGCSYSLNITGEDWTRSLILVLSDTLQRLLHRILKVFLF